MSAQLAFHPIPLGTGCERTIGYSTSDTVTVCSIVQGGSLADLKSPSISFCLGSISKTILLAVRAIYAQNEYIFSRSGGERKNTNYRE